MYSRLFQFCDYFMLNELCVVVCILCFSSYCLYKYYKYYTYYDYVTGRCPRRLEETLWSKIGLLHGQALLGDRLNGEIRGGLTPSKIFVNNARF